MADISSKESLWSPVRHFLQCLSVISNNKHSDNSAIPCLFLRSCMNVSLLKKLERLLAVCFSLDTCRGGGGGLGRETRRD